MTTSEKYQYQINLAHGPSGYWGGKLEVRQDNPYTDRIIRYGPFDTQEEAQDFIDWMEQDS